MRSVECVVVGGGPAGLAAARTAARHGVRVLLVDEGLGLGGRSRGRPGAPGAPLLDDVWALGVEVRLETAVWGIFDQRVVALATAEASDRVAADAIVLAPGAYDRPVPFPGWTLPGVITAGGALELMRSHGVLPGRRVLVAGSGSMLLTVAQDLLRGGAAVVAVCEAAPMRRLWRVAPRMLAHLDVVQQTYRRWREIRDAGVPILTGRVIRRALGSAEVAGAVVAPCDEQWWPRVGEEERFDVDALVVGYGLLPSIELSRVAGCEHRWEADVGGYVPVRNRDMESSVPGVYVVGDGARVAGAAAAEAEGHVAGLAVAHRLGRLEGRDHLREASRARGRLLHLSGVRRVMGDMYGFGAGLYALADDRTVLCRCEEVTVGETLHAVREGAAHVDEVKAWTRVGMGRCQGRMCGPALAHLIAGATRKSVTEVGALMPRAPVRPVLMGALARDAAAESLLDPR